MLGGSNIVFLLRCENNRTEAETETVAEIVHLFPCSTKTLFLWHQRIGNAGLTHTQVTVGRGFVFNQDGGEGGQQSHGRFTSPCTVLFKRMQEGGRLMIYCFVPPLKSKWILESAQLLNPDLEEYDL